MSGTTVTATVYPTPPPTSNRLGSNQRHRLMKSTDKLARVLGTTPYLLEVSELPITLLPVGNSKKATKASRRERSIISHSASSSSSSLTMNGSVTSLPSSNSSTDSLPTVPRPAFSDAKSKATPPALYIRLNTVPVSPSDNRFMSSFPPTPSTATPLGTSSSYTFPPSPPTPNFDQSEIRRKRMAKLARHLGETIPPQLVFPTPRYSPSPLAGVPSVRRRRSMSVGDGSLMASEFGCKHYMPAVGDIMQCSLEEQKEQLGRNREASWVGEWNRGNMQEVQHQLRALKAR